MGVLPVPGSGLGECGSVGRQRLEGAGPQGQPRDSKLNSVLFSAFMNVPTIKFREITNSGVKGQLWVLRHLDPNHGERHVGETGPNRPVPEDGAASPAHWPSPPDHTGGGSTSFCVSSNSGPSLHLSCLPCKVGQRRPALERWGAGSRQPCMCRAGNPGGALCASMPEQPCRHSNRCARHLGAPIDSLGSAGCAQQESWPSKCSVRKASC